MMNATLSLSSELTTRPQPEARPASGFFSMRGVKVPRVVLGLSLAILVQACVVVLVIGAAWAGVI